MKFYSSKIDFTDYVKSYEGIINESFDLGGLQKILQFNPVTTLQEKEPKIAFFGLNAYCHENDLSNALKETNYAVWCQRHYNKKIFSVIKRWLESSLFKEQECAHYSNVVKVVLPQSNFAKESEVNVRFKQYQEALSALQEMAAYEVNILKKNGCQYFVCFGHSAFNFMKPVAKECGVEVIREYHFSRYSIKNTNTLIKALL